jgi:hypothetical protein
MIETRMRIGNTRIILHRFIFLTVPRVHTPCSLNLLCLPVCLVLFSLSSARTRLSTCHGFAHRDFAPYDSAHHDSAGPNFTHHGSEYDYDALFEGLDDITLKSLISRVRLCNRTPAWKRRPDSKPSRQPVASPPLTVPPRQLCIHDWVSHACPP